MIDSGITKKFYNITIVCSIKIIKSVSDFSILSYIYIMHRWIKFEEDVEEGGNRWSKPHVATLSLHSLFELRSLLLNGTVMLDMEAISLEQIADLVLDNMINKGVLSVELREKVRTRILGYEIQCLLIN